MVHQVKIEWSTDSHECDDCGTSFATGAIVRVDDVVILNVPAIAHCYTSTHLETEDVYKKILEHLGCVIMESGS